MDEIDAQIVDAKSTQRTCRSYLLSRMTPREQSVIQLESSSSPWDLYDTLLLHVQPIRIGHHVTLAHPHVNPFSRKPVPIISLALLGGKFPNATIVSA